MASGRSLFDVQTMIIDHVMFPVYHNPEFLEKTGQYWTKMCGNSAAIVSQQLETFDNVIMYTRDFYVEHVSVHKDCADEDQYWSNAICIELNVKHWDKFKDPIMRDENFLVPYAGCGYFFVNPKYEFTHRSTRTEGTLLDGCSILISEGLKKELERVTNGKTLPHFVKVDRDMKHNYDIAVITREYKLVAPYLQPNFPLVRQIDLSN